jgi:hypothetical protein
MKITSGPLMLIENLVARKNLVICCLLALFAFQSFMAIKSKSATFDEVQYFGIGKYLITEHKWDIMGAILHPPLSYYVNSLPLLFVHEDKKLWNYDVKERDLKFLGAVDYYRGLELLSADFNAGDKLLIASRCMTLLVSLLLGVYIYRFSALFFGIRGGLISLFSFTFCPNMLAFSGICVPDMPLTAFSLISVYYLWRSLHEDNKILHVYAGVSLGLALLCKFPALLLVPLAVAVTFVVMYTQRRNLLPRLIILGAVAFLVMLAGYQGDLTPFIQGNQYRLMQQEYGQSAYLMGQYSAHGWWYFYPLTILMKSPLPLLILFPLAAGIMFRDMAKYGTLLMVLLAPILLYLTVFSLSGYSIALRYLLPVYPFVFITIGVLATIGTKYRYYLAVAAIWYVASSVSVAPHYLAYFNEAFGGPGNGYRYLADANLDWGQDLKELKKFMERNGIEKISLSYFGADNAERYGIDYDWLPSHYLYNPTPDKPYEIKPDQLVAVSVTNLLGIYLEDRGMYLSLLQHEPVAKIGYSIYVYDLSGRRKFKL